MACLQTEEMELSRGGPLQDWVRDLPEEETGAAGTQRQASLGGRCADSLRDVGAPGSVVGSMEGLGLLHWVVCTQSFVVLCPQLGGACGLGWGLGSPKAHLVHKQVPYQC